MTVEIKYTYKSAVLIVLTDSKSTTTYYVHCSPFIHILWHVWRPEMYSEFWWGELKDK
jgi:hypothetical protein